MRSTHCPDNSHHSHAANNANTPNTPKHAGTNAGGLRSRSKLAKRAAARLARVKVAGILDARLLITFIAIALVATILTATAYMRPQAPPQEPTRLEAAISIKDSKGTKAKEQTQSEPAAPIDINAPNAVTLTTYPFSNTTGIALEDMSSGTTTLVGANLDDNVSAVTNIGFDYWYDGVRFTQFSANANGIVRLGGTVITTSFDNSTDFASTTNAPKIAPYFDDLWTGTNGKVHTKVIGSAPSRKLVVEWQNEQIPRVGSGNAGAGTFQLWLFETTGVIEFVYGSGIALNTVQGGYSIGLQSGAASNIASVTTTGATVSYAAANNTQTNAIAATTAYLFTPNVPAAPTGLSFPTVTSSAITLNWSDIATNEVGYAIYQSNDGGVNYSFVTQTAPSATSQVISGLNPSTTYFFKVFAVTEGALSTALSGSQATNAPTTITSTAAGGNWSAVATWVGGAVPTANDNVVIANSATVTIDITTATCLNLTVGQGTSGILQYISTPASTLTVNADATVATGGIFTAGAGSLTTHVLNIGGSTTGSGAAGNLMVSGVFDMNTTAGVTTNFFGTTNGTLSGAGATADFFAIVGQKGTNQTAILDVTRVITIASPTASGSRLTVNGGTIKFSSATSATPWFGSNTITGANGKLWINNAAASLQCVGTGVSATGAGSPTITGGLQIDAGTFGYGQGNNAMSVGGQLILGGASATVNMFGSLTFTANSTFTMTAGNINIDPQNVASLAASSNILRFGTGAVTVNATGGTITIVDPHAGATGAGKALSISSASAAENAGYNFAGSTLRLGNGVSTTAGSVDGFDLDAWVGLAPSPVPLGNVTVDNTATNAATRFVRSQTLSPFTQIYNGNLTITSAGGSDFRLNGNIIEVTGNVVNNGVLNGSASGSILWFLGNGLAQNYSGAGTFTGPMPNLVFENTLGVTLSAAANIVTRGLVIFSGSVTNANKITLGNGDATASTVQIGNTTTATPAGTLDVAPTFNLGAGGESISYLRTTLSRTTGPEVNPTRTLISMSYDDNDTTHSLTVAGGDLTLSGTTAALAATNGRIITGANTLILSSGAATVTRTTGYVDGNFRKAYSASANKTFEVGTANGYSPVAVNATAGTFPTTFTVKATQGQAPYVSGPNALQRYWTLTGSAITTANLTFTYLPTDVVGTVASYQFIRNSGGTLSTLAPTGTPTSTTAVINGVSSFSDWTLAEAAAVLPGSLQLSSATYTDSETNADHVFNVPVTRTGGSDGNVSVTYTVTDGSATLADNDYIITPASGSLNWLSGDATPKNIAITVKGDPTFEPDETVNIAITVPTGGATLGSPNTAVLTIQNDDAAPDITFNASGNLNAGTYNNITINSPAVVTMTGNVVVNGCVFVNSGSTLLMGTFTFTGAGCFTLNSGATLGIGSTAGITTGATGNVQVGGTRTFSTGASYVYNGSADQAVGNALPGTVANLTINNSGTPGTVTGNLGQVVTGTLSVVDGVYLSGSDYNDVSIAADGTLSLAADITVSGNWTNNDGTFSANGFRVTFDGTGTQVISRPSGETFARVTVNKASGTAQFQGAVSIIANSGNVLELLSGATESNGNLNLLNNGGNVLVSGGVRTIGTSSAGNVSILGTKTVTSTGGGTLVVDANVDVQLGAAVDFGASLTTINAQLILNSGGAVNTNAPTYGAGSTLSYQNNGSVTRGAEWTSTTGSTFPSVGYPNNVVVGNNAVLSVGAPGGTTTNWAINGSLTVSNTGTFSLAGGSPMTVPVTIKGNVNIATGGTLLLSSAPGGDLNVGGNWTKTGTFTPNGRTVTFNGGTGQTLAGNTSFFNLVKSTGTAQTMNFAAGSVTEATNSLTFNGASGNLLSLRSTTPGVQWNLKAPTTQSVDYVDVQDSNASTGQLVTATNSVDSGNNVNWSFAAPCTPPSIVYVDDSWVGTTPGTDPDGGAGPATNFGCDSFATIQDGVNGVATSGTVNVANGLYTENVTISQALTLTGAGAAGVTLRPAISDPNCGGAGGGSLCAGASNLILVAANNVTISGLTLDGDNTTLTSGQVFGGADIDARNGIITNHLAGVFNNLEVHHTTVENIWLRGMYASSSGTFNFHDNTVQNVQANVASIGMFNFGGAGAYTNNTVSACNDAISSNHSRGTTYTGNTVTTSASGIHSDNAGDSGGTPDTISGNTVTNSQVFGYGIWVFVPYKTVTVQNNTVTNVDVGLAVFGDSGVTTTTKPQKGEHDQDVAAGRTAPPSANVPEPSVLLVPRAFNDGLPDPNAPNAPPVAPFAASFKGNTVDGQNKANSTGVYFTTSQIGFGSGNPKVEFTTNTVLNNVDGFYLEAETGFTLETAASFNRIVNNTTTQVTQASGGGFTGTLNGSMENNWWGCNAGPGNAGCGVVVGAGVDFNPWIVLGISASPSTIPPGGSTTVTADMTHNSVNAVPSVTEFVPQVAVTFGAVNGTVFPTSGTITNGQATTTFTSNSTSSGSASATVDNQTVSTPITVSAVNTYTWSPTLGTSWILPINWTPTRFLPQTNDTLVINGTTTPAPTITNVPTQTIAGLHLINSAQATLQAGGTSTLTISGMSGSDLTVPAGSFLTLDGSNGLTIKVSGAGTAGTIGGGVAAQGGFHRLFGDAGGGITFQSGGIGTAGPGLTSNMFGTGGVGDGAANSVTFANGSFYFHNAGGSPFGVAPNPAVVVFQTGSLATFLTASGFEASGRTYADLAIGKVDPGGVAVNASDSGSGNFTFDHLAVNSTGTTNSSLTYNGSGASSINILHRIDSNGVGNGGTLPDVILTAGSGGIVMNNPGETLVFGNDGNNTRSVEFESSASVGTNTELLLDRKLLVGISQPSSFVLTVNGVLNGSATGYVIGNVKRPVATPETFIYHVGTPNGYSPLDATFTAGTGDLTVVARQGAQPVLMSATSLQRYWTLTEGGAVTADLTFHYNSPDVLGTEANYRLVIVESGNATSFPENCPNVACVDESANTIKRTGVQTFSDWTAAEPAAPTAVNLTGFTATRSGDEVKLQWQSGYEARNLGYNIYREQDGKRVAITPSLVAGSALVAGNRTRLTAGLSYSWYDQLPGGRGQGTGGSGRQSTVDGRQSPVTYWLEDVDLNGTRTLHGPIAIAECGMANADCKKISERSKLLGEIANPQSAIRNSQFNDGVQLKGWPAAVTVPDSHDPEPDPLETQRTIAGMTGLKISVSRAGWYRITQPEVLAAGLNIADANGLQLYRDGRQVAFRLSNSSEQFGPADYLEFYGEGLNSATATAQTYYLVKLAEPGKRVEVKPQVVSPGDRVSPQGFAYTVERKERMTYFSALLNGDAENFFGQIVSSTGATAAIPVNHLDATTQSAGTPAQLEVALQGVTNQSHLVQVRINGTDLGTINFAGTEHPSQTFSVPAAALVDGNNNVELTSLGGAADVSLVDVLRLTYIRSYVADNNAISFNLESRQTKRITGFTTDHIRLIDVTDPNEPLELTPYVSPDGAGFAVLVGVDKEVRAPFSRPHKLLAFVEGQTDAVDALGLNEPSSLWSETAGADYVMISTADLKASIEPLAQLRRNQGMVVQVVDVENLYDEFTFGEHSPRAIHDFLERAMTTWTRQPHYLLLAGDASYDPKNYLGQGLNDLVPTKLIDTALTETASDDWLADFNGDGVADLSSGRLPVRTVAETEALVSKFISYENMAPDPSRGALLVADTNFEGPSSAVASQLPAGFPVQTINRAGGDDATTHNQIIASLNQGPRVANYYGHGSNGVWTGAGLLSSNDAPALANTNRLSVFTMMTCFNGYFQDAYNDSLSEALLKSQGGAVAVWASTTLTEPAGQNVIGAEFYRLLFGPQPITLGDAARSARIVTTDADVRRTWTLLGDPAMRLR